MSINKNQELSSWNRLLARLESIRTYRNGVSLSLRDHKTWCKALLLYVLMIDDISSRYSGVCAPGRNNHIAILFANYDVMTVASFLSDFVLFLREYYEADTMTYTGIKLRFKDYPFSGAFFASFREMIEEHLLSPTPYTFRPLYQVASFLSHLSFKDIDMSKELEDEYVATELRLASHVYPTFLVNEVKLVIDEWFSDLHVTEENFLPKHGPGSTFETNRSLGLIPKYLFLGAPENLCRVGYWTAGLDLATFCPFPIIPHVDISKVIFVPKSIKTKRVISKEPASLQFFQQGIDSVIRDYIRKHPYLKDRIDFENQSIQQGAARLASQTRNHATVDLSAASDSVSWYLIRKVFTDCAIFPWLEELRSTRAQLPSGKMVDMNKFAPMGSALCFPIETILFSAICEVTSRYVHAVSGVSHPDYRVYGDDIIVHEDLVFDLMHNLRHLGFLPNNDKSYSGDYRFRESCGCDAFDGADVTPMKIGRNFSADRITSHSPALWSCYIDMANSAYLYKLDRLRRYIISDILASGYIPLFSRDGNRGLLTSDPTNYRLSKRWSNRYQRYEVKAALPVSRKKHAPGDDHLEQARYHEWLRSTSRRTTSPGVTNFFDIVEAHVIDGCTLPSESSQRIAIDSSFRLRSVWVPLWDYTAEQAFDYKSL